MKWCSHSRTHFFGFFTNLNMQLPEDSAIALLGIYPKETDMYVHTKAYITTCSNSQKMNSPDTLQQVNG